MLSVFTEIEVKKIQSYIHMSKVDYENKIIQHEKEKDNWVEADMLNEYFNSLQYIKNQIEILTSIENKINDYVNNNYNY